MTIEELKSLPEVNGKAFGYPDIIMDENGARWMVGMYEGKLCKTQYDKI